MHKKNCLVIGFFAIGFWVSAQTLSPEVIAPGGAESQAPSITLEWTLGELMVETQSAEKNLLTEGFHQPVLTVFEMPTILFHESGTATTEMNIRVWPTPVQYALTIQLEIPTNEKVLLELYNLSGKRLHAQSISSHGSTELDFSNHVPGSYFLKCSQSDGTLFKSFVIVKQ